MDQKHPSNREIGAGVDRLYAVTTVAIWLFIMVMVVGGIWFWIDPASFPGVGYERLRHFANPADLTAGQRILGAAVTIPSTAVVIIALLSLKKVAACFKGGEFFTLETHALTRRAGIMMILYLPLSILWTAALSAIATFHNAEGERYVSVTLGNIDLAVLLIGLILLIFARALKQARDQREELNQIV